MQILVIKPSIYNLASDSFPSLSQICSHCSHIFWTPFLTAIHPFSVNTYSMSSVKSVVTASTEP